MKYIVIQGRLPQDGSKAATALIMFPSWVSPTLVCAGVIGRVQELTDGGIIEQGAFPMEEQAALDMLRLNIERGNFDPTAPALPNNAPHAAEDAYREGMQRVRDDLNTQLKPYLPEGASVKPVWLLAQLEELAQFRKDRPETLKRLQDAEDNLDAWRTAAAANPLIVQDTDENGRIRSLGVFQNASALARDTSVGAVTLKLELDTTEAMAQLEKFATEAAARYTNALKGE